MSSASMIPSGSLRIIVLGYIVRGPIGGMVWNNLQFLMGLARLGHDVYFVEDSDDYPSCYEPLRNITAMDPTDLWVDNCGPHLRKNRSAGPLGLH